MLFFPANNAQFTTGCAEYRTVGNMGNTVLQQVGTIVPEKDRVYLLQCCAFDLYGIEFCNNISRKLSVNFAKSYH